MNLDTWLAELATRGVAVWEERGQLRYRGPPEVVTPALLGLLKENKAEVLRWLAEDAAADQGGWVGPMSYGQQALWTQHQLAPESPAYNMACLARLPAGLEVDRFRQCLERQFARHAILRTVYRLEAGQPVQEVRPVTSLPLEIIDITEWTPVEQDAWIAAAADRPFDLGTGPVARLHLLLRRARGPDATEYLLLMVSHHIALDFWAFEMVMDEVGQEYAAGNSERRPLRRTTGGRYRDFVRWQTALLAGPAGARMRAFWLQQLSGELPVLELPRDRPRPDWPTYAGATHPFELDRDLTGRIIQLAKAADTTPYVVCLTAFHVLLARYSGQTDLLVGTPSSGRSQSEFSRLVGYCVNPLVLRTDLSGEPTVLETISRVRRTVLASLEHQDYPFQLLQEALPLRGTTRGAPLYQAAFAWDRSQGNQLDERKAVSRTAGQLFQDILWFEQRGAATELDLLMVSAGDRLRGRWTYRTGLFSAGTIGRLAEHFLRILRGITTQPDAVIHQLPLLTEKERHQLLVDWNATAAPLPPAGCVHELFEAQVQRTPEATAVVFADETLSYAELNARANQLAHALIKLGVGPDLRVAIALERSPAMIVALLATLKAGGAYVPLDLAYPAERLAFMLEDCGAKVLITQESLRGQWPQVAAHTLCLDTGWAALATEPKINLPRRAGPNDLAYVIYTSGSTGQPKGVAVEHRGLSNLAQVQISSLGLTPDSRVLQFASFSFDASVWEVVMAFGAGATLHLPNPEQRMPGAPLRQYLAAAAITHLTLSPTALAALPPVPLPDLACLIVAGEACPPALAAFWSKGRRFFNAYGPTETTVCATMAECAPADFDVAAVLPIGRPIANTRLYVLDGHGQPVPVGVPGELFIGGAGLARGYLNRPELTAEKFVADPFSGISGARLYRTGDLVRYRPDGNLEFLGRLDHQVKIRGFRIELGEIEAALVAHPTIRECVVVARKDQSGEQRLVAYLVAATEPAPPVGELRTFLKATLPEYMLPAAFVFLSSLPLTPNGKVDRQALPEPEAAVPEAAAEAPRDALEEILVGLWATVLRHPGPGRHGNFFELGGHSLLATQLASRVRDAVGVDVPVRWLFEAPTVAALAGRIRHAQTGGPDGETSPPIPANRILPGTTRITPDLLPLVTLSQPEIDQVARTVEGGAANLQDIYPLAPLQEGILFHYQMQAAGDAYLSHALLAFDSRARRTAFLAALQAVIDRHDILRTAVVWEQLTEPVQVVWRQAPLPVETLHFDPAQGPIAGQLVAHCDPRHSRLDLTRAPLLRVALTEDGGQILLLLLFHHLVMDHSTMEILFSEIAAFLQGEAQRLPAPVPFRNFAVATRTGVARAAHEAFFREMLGAIDTPTAPFNLLDVQGDGSTIVEARRDLPPELVRRLLDQTQRLGVTPAALCHLAWALVLSRCCGQDEVVLGTVLFGRMQGGAGIERALGLFINTLPLRLTCDARPVTEALRETQRALLALMQHEHAPLSLAQRCAAVPAPTPLFSTLLNYRHTPALADAGHLLPGVELLQTEERSNYPLALSVDDRGRDFGLTAQVDASVDPERICGFMQGGLTALVAALEAAPLTPLCELDILPATERQRLLFDWNATTAALPPETCVHELFEAQVRRTPEATAVAFQKETLRYGELNARANQLAHALIKLGVGPDLRVALALERSPAMIVALLATLKAGGAFVPLDPAYPAGRLAFMLEDCGAKVLITQESLRDQWPQGAAHTLCLDTGWAAIATEPKANPPRRATPENLAYVIYTSGSTGQPKGVAVEHRSLACHCQTIAVHYELTPKDRVFQFASFSFDTSVEQILPALCVGAATVLAPAGLQSAEAIDACMRQHGATVLNLPPAFFRLWAAACGADLPPLLRLVILGGDLLAPEALNVRALWPKPGPRLLNAYGPTEATVTTTCFDIPEALSGAIVPIGRPLPQRTVYVLDRHGQPAPVGVPGELFIGGAGLARGYLNRPELTAKKFVADPFSGISGARLYRTGDLVRYRPDGNLEFLGRLDHQVKIRGFRIELGEIEATLVAHPTIRECVVVARKDQSGEQRLVAYLVAATEPAPPVGELRTFLKATLPEYMLPAAFVFLSSLPLTPNGKVDRQALPEPEAAVPEAAAEAPRDALEEILVGLWATVLRHPGPGRHGNFFELGGHSLLATQLASRVRDALSVDVPVRWLFEAPTAAQLAERLRPILSGQRTDEETSEVQARTIAPIPRNCPLPLSFAQQRLWFLDQLEGPSPTYNMPGMLELSGDLNPVALHGAFSEILRRHESLRTCLVAEQGEPHQVIQPAQPLELPTIDLRHSADPAAETNRLAREEALRPFDLARELPLRARLLQRGDQGWTLLLTLHHSAADGWSIGILIRELATLYGAFRLGQPSPLPELAIQYADFAQWQRAYLTGTRFAQQVDIWRRRLAGAPECLNLPTDRPRPPQQTYRGATVRFTLAPELTSGLQALSQRSGATLFMTLLAAWANLLGRYSGEDDLVIGSPVANRTQSAIEPLIGFFVNTLALRADLSGNPSFLELLARLRHVCLEAYAQQELPFESLVEALEVPRHLAHAPLFQVMFVLQNTPQEALALPGLELTLAESESTVAKFDLTLSVAPVAGALAATLEYATDLFERPTIARMAGHFVQLLRSAVARPDQTIGTLDFLPTAERQQLLVDWNATTAALPPETCVHELFEAQVRRTPEATAVVFADETLSYTELNARANQLAHALIKLGVGPDLRVAIALERSPAMIVALLGTLKAGGAYVPLDPAYPAGRLAFMLEDCGAKGLITQESLRGQWPQVAAHTLCLDTGWAAIATEPKANPPRRATPENLAYVIYTSGSTGQPKGVAMPHAPLCNLISWQLLNPRATRARTLQYTSLSFDVSFQEIACTLAAGACLFLVDDETRRDSSKLIRFIDVHQIGRLFMPYVALSDLCETAVQSGTIPPALRAVFTAGEQLRITPAIAQFFQSTGASLHNHYGPTESHVVTAFDLCPDVSLWPVLPSIGRPITNTQLYVLDGHRQPVPVGVPGELYIGGAGLARGYLNRPELTAKKFVADPFSGISGTRLYRTGDLVRYRPDGNLEFLGRLDHQVKIRGFRIELGEIEAALVAHPTIRECVVVARKDQSGEQRLVAYLVAATEPAPPVGELRTFLKATLPEYMLPAAFVFLSSLPLTPNGKVDRQALPEPEAAVPEAAAEAPRDALEEILVGLWATVLRHPGPGRHGNFFELGGHSLLATQLASRVRDALSVDVPVRWLFEAPTAAQLAERLRPILSGQRTDEETSEVQARTIAPIPRNCPLPLSFAQQRLWFLDQLEGPSPTYNMPGMLELSGDLNPVALHGAFSEILRRHESLRTCLVAEQGEPHQVIQPAQPLELPTIDLRHSADPAAETNRLAREEALRPFDLARELPLRARLLQRGDQGWTLLLTLHHSAADGWSIGILIRELATLYGAFRLGQPSPLPELAIQYADFAQWQRAYLTGTRFAQQVDIWRRRLAGAPECLNLPTDRPRPPQQTYRGATVRFTLAPELTSGLQALSQRSGATLFMTLLAAWANLLGRYSGEDDLVIGSPVANRTQSAIEPLIGFFVNTLALRADLSGNPSFLELLARLRHVCLEAYAQQELPFESLVEALEVPRHLAHAPLFQVMFVLQNTPQEALALPGLELTLAESESTVAKFDLTLSVAPVAGALAATLEYATDLFERPTIARMAGHFVQLLRSAVARPDQTIGTLDFLPTAERQQLLVDWNATTAVLPPETCVHELFEAQVRRTPEATAVVFADETLSYTELNARANQLAHALIKLGFGPDLRVALALERSPAMIVALLGTLKAGGSYVPLDPAYPAGRLAFMLEDCGAKVLITQESLRGQWPQVAAHTLCLDTGWTAIATEPKANPPRRATPENLAYVIYTSGSTGQPKGVAVEHRSLACHCQTIAVHYELTPKDRVFQFASFSFDTSVEQILPALCVGAATVLAPAGLQSAEAIDACMRQHGATVLNLPPAFFRLWAAACGADLPPLLRLVILGGDLLAPEALNVRALWPKPGPRLLNAYGPTEATVTTTCFDIPEALSGAIVPIGRPLPQRTVYVLDRHGQPAPVGVPGELYIGGAGLARGYLNRPELTAEKFVADPFSGEPGARLYRTGDLVRYRSDGNLEFLGRLDHQVKIRGFRIELGEIEATLVAHPAIRESVVIARQDETGELRLVAYLVPATEPVSPVGELRAFLKATLPEYMLPAAFVFLSSLPLTPNGKVDRQALPEPGVRREGKQYRVPRDTIEQLLVQIWEKLLPVRPIGIRDNFFEIGGHSLLAVRLVAEIDRRLSKRLPVSRLFEYPTIAGIASLLRRDGEMPKESCLVRIRAEGSRPPLFFLPGAGGVANYLYPLAQLLDPQIPFLAFQAQGLDGKSPPHASIKAMAEHYVALLLEAQPRGPYFLAGHSLGGRVAWGMAQLLLARGQAIGFLGIVDTSAPDTIAPHDDHPIPDDTSLLLDVGKLVGQLFQTEMAVSREDLAGLDSDAQLACVARPLEAAGLLPEGGGRDHLRRVFTVYKAHLGMDSRPILESSRPLPITLIRASEPNEDQSPESSLGEDLGWGRYSSRAVPVHYVPGDHVTMMRPPHVGKLAQLLAKLITVG